MAKRLSNEASISEVLQNIIENNKLQFGINEVEVRTAWRILMGNGVNSYTQDLVLKGTTLYVSLSSAVLREELLHGKSKIIKMLNEELQREVVTNLVLR